VSRGRLCMGAKVGARLMRAAVALSRGAQERNVVSWRQPTLLACGMHAEVCAHLMRGGFGLCGTLLLPCPALAEGRCHNQSGSARNSAASVICLCGGA